MATKGTLKYRKVTRTPQSGPNKNKQMYYATAVTDREMNFEEFVTHISEHNSPYSRGTVHGVLMDTLAACRSSSSMARAYVSPTWVSSPSV